MAQCQWQPNFYTSISTVFKKNLSLKCRVLIPSNTRICICNVDKKTSLHTIVVQCCSSSSSFPVSSTTTREQKHHDSVEGNVGRKQNGDYEVECFVNDENGWKVRRIVDTKEETKKVARIQAEAFYEPGPIFNDVFSHFFQAEILSGLLYKLRNNPPDRYACLVAEHSSDNPEVEQDLVGVVDATIYNDKDVLQYFPGANEYLYISGIAVSNKFRRQKVATTLLKACDVLARLWGFHFLVLWAHEDDFGARQLYENAGYVVIASDPPWKSTWIGRRKRVLMVKQVI